MILVIIGSSDCSVSLNSIFGQKIGVFGQEEHWKIESFMFSDKSNDDRTLQISDSNNETSLGRLDITAKDDLVENSRKTPVFLTQIKTSNDTNETNDVVITEDMKLMNKLNQKLKLEETFLFEDDAFIKNPSLRYNPWSKTILGML